MRFVFLVLLLSATRLLCGQADKLLLSNIHIEGNSRTRDAVILREMTVQAGDSITCSALSKAIKHSRQLIINTGLFSRVELRQEIPAQDQQRVDLYIKVQETWYIYPSPYFSLADRNLNTWLEEHGASLERTKIGLDVIHLNLTGRGDQIKLGARYGYTREFEFSYDLPYINDLQNVGISTDIFFSQRREVSYATKSNRQVFFEDENRFNYSRFHAALGVNYRPGAFTYHDFTLSYQQNRINNKISTELNPEFFLDGRNMQRYFSFDYRFTVDQRDVRAYPMEGSYTVLELEKDGLGIFNDRHGLTLFSTYGRFFQLGERWRLTTIGRAKLSLIRSQQPYHDSRAIGFGNNDIRGYEYYIVDGMDMLILNSSIRYKVFQEQINFGKLMPIKAFREMPFKVYFGLNSDWGYANNPFDESLNSFDNRLLWGGGLGMDLVMFYDKIFRVEYSFNHLIESGLFFHLNLNI